MPQEKILFLFIDSVAEDSSPGDLKSVAEYHCRRMSIAVFGGTIQYPDESRNLHLVSALWVFSFALLVEPEAVQLPNQLIHLYDLLKLFW